MELNLSNTWKPNGRIAIALGFFLQPFTFLYVGRGKAFLFSMLGILLGALALFFFAPNVLKNMEYFGWGVGLLFAFFGWYCSSEPIDIPRPWYSKWWGIVSSGLIFFIPVVLIRAFVIESYSIPSRSMSPTLSPGQVVFVSKWGYGNYGTYGLPLVKTQISNPILRGDILVFTPPHAPQLDYVKRVIGLPGDHVFYSKKSVVVKSNCDQTCSNNLIESEFVSEWQSDHLNANQTLLKYSEATNTNSYNVIIDPKMPSFTSRFYDQTGTEQGHWIVPDGHVFMMGDNRDSSEDSRYYGFVPISNVKGSVVLVW